LDDLYLNIVLCHQTAFLYGGTYQLKIISAPSEKSPVDLFVHRITMLLLLLINVMVGDDDAKPFETIWHRIHLKMMTKNTWLP